MCFAERSVQRVASKWMETARGRLGGRGNLGPSVAAVAGAGAAQQGSQLLLCSSSETSPSRTAYFVSSATLWRSSFSMIRRR